MKNIKNYSGVATTAVLLFLTLNTIMAGHCIRKSNEERYAFYNKKISFATERSLTNKNIFYFDYNNYAINNENRLVLFAHSKKLLKYPRLNVLISGHTDSKGSLWYNLKLGNQRALSVAEILASKGVHPDRMTIISYANQVPIINNDDNKDNYNKDFEKLNRRVEIIYQYKESN